MKRLYQKNDGFTLMELLVSMGIISFLVLVLVQTFISTVRTSTKSEALREIKQNGDYSVSTMTRMIQGAAVINTPVGTSLTLTITGNDGLWTRFEAANVSGICKIASVSAARTHYLTSSNVHLNPCSVTFTVDDVNGTPANVKYVFTLQQKPTLVSNVDAATMTFQSSTQLRNVDF